VQNSDQGCIPSLYYTNQQNKIKLCGCVSAEPVRLCYSSTGLLFYKPPVLGWEFDVSLYSVSHMVGVGGGSCSIFWQKAFGLSASVFSKKKTKTKK